MKKLLVIIFPYLFFFSVCSYTIFYLSIAVCTMASMDYTFALFTIVCELKITIPDYCSVSTMKAFVHILPPLFLIDSIISYEFVCINKKHRCPYSFICRTNNIIRVININNIPTPKPQGIALFHLAIHSIVSPVCSIQLTEKTNITSCA